MDFPDATLKQRLGRAITPLFMLRARLMRPMTFGVRVAGFDESGRVFLVKHTYVPGWYLPGGAVDPGETVEQAARREAMEEGNLVVDGPMDLRGIYQNHEVSVRDHVAFYVARNVSQTAPRLPDREIADSGFFELDALPQDATGATRRRLDELSGARQPDGYW